MRRTEMDTKKKATRVVIGLLVGMSVFSLMGCGTKVSAKTNDSTSSCQEFIDEDGQDNTDQCDYLAFVGTYKDSSKYGATCDIDEGETPQTADISVSIDTGDNGNKYELWNMTAKYDADKDQLTYTSCRHTKWDDGCITDEEELGSGYFQMDSKSDVNKFTWSGVDNGKYSECTFTQVSSESPSGTVND